MQERLKQFNAPITATQDNTLLDEALGLYEAWVKKIENK
jgi:hypothetical protein